jgi:hypothetical protein
MLSGVWGSVRGWTSTLPNELPLWKLESQWSPESSKSDCKGQNPLDWRFPYIIKKLLEVRCLKWACMTHLDISNTSYAQKKGRESNCQIWLLSTKSWELPQFLAFTWCATYRWKFFDEGYNFPSDFISIKGLHTTLCAPKIVGVPTLEILGLPLGSPETKWHLGAGHVAKHKVYYKGEGGGLPQVRVVVSLVNPCLLVVRLSTKNI